MTPVEIASVDRDFFCDLVPVTTGFEGLDDVIREVAAASGESVCFDGA